MNEQYTLTIEDSMDDFDVQDVKWKLEYNVNDIYAKYKSSKNKNEFIKKYKELLLSKKDDLIKIGKDCWNDLAKIINDKDIDNILPYLDKIYDWADKYGVKIISKNENK